MRSRYQAVMALAAVAAMAGAAAPAQAVTIRFDDLILGLTTYDIDADGDGIRDVTFSTTDPGGFGTNGPGLNQSYISEPGLEGTSTLAPDLRIDFAYAPTGTLSFGFAVSSESVRTDWTANFRVYSAANVLLGQTTVVAAYTVTPTGRSGFPEGLVTLSFAGAAAYGLFDFTSQFGRYIIDDFTGNFGSASAVPENTTASMMLAGAALLCGAGWRRRRPA